MSPPYYVWRCPECKQQGPGKPTDDGNLGIRSICGTRGRAHCECGSNAEWERIQVVVPEEALTEASLVEQPDD